ncbi:hypothetical protein [Coleofasciculus sp.]
MPNTTAFALGGCVSRVDVFCHLNDFSSRQKRGFEQQPDQNDQQDQINH